MDDSLHSDAILALGCKLVEELELEPSVNTLPRWMAHYIADLITSVEKAKGKERRVVEKKCFEAILDLWEHRAELPNGKRPFEDLEPIIRAVESLDPEDDTPRYFRSLGAPKKEGEEKSEADSWLETVNGIDHSAKVLIGYCLARAAHTTIDKSKEWVALAEAAGVEDGVPEIVTRFISSAAELENDPDPSADLRRQLENRIQRLEGFAKMSEALATDMKARLKELSPSKEGDD